MHRHGYQGRKFGREKGPRTAMISSLAEALVVSGAIKTTRPKAKELLPMFEKLITRAKKADLASRRELTKILSVSSTHKLVDEIAPKLSARSSGHLRIKPHSYRRGDNATMVSISFVDDLKTKSQPKPKTSSKPSVEEKPKADEPRTATAQNIDHQTNLPHGTADKQGPRRTGVRGNR